MKRNVQKNVSVIIALVLCITFGVAVSIYANPMENVSLNLSLMPEGEDFSPENFDDKGWTVYTQEGDAVTELTPDGFGGYLGVELGQTFYFSRVMEEELDAPILQISSVESMFAVFLDDDLIYTDCPELDNRIGYLTLPMNEWLREESITISLPQSYHGKTLTIAQSMPEYAETATVMAYPTNVMLYCGYAYESGLIAESFSTAVLATVAFVVGVVLLLAFVRNGDAGMLCIALVAFLWMISTLFETSFHDSYFGIMWYDIPGICRMFSALALLIFLISSAGRLKKVMWGLIALYGVSLIVYTAIIIVNPMSINSLLWFLQGALSEWIVCIAFLVVSVLGILYWRKESRFYRLFTPLSVGIVVVFWTVLMLTDGSFVWEQLVLSLGSGSITFVYYRLLPLMMIAALAAALVEAVKSELDRRTEKQVLENRRQLTLESYENMRRQHEEVMMLRHDMSKHFLALQEMSSEETIKAYLNELIGQNQNIRPVVQCGNEMLDIILNSKLSAAADAGIKVEIVKANAPEKLPLSDADLCSLVMNIMDNALTAAAGSGEADPFIRLNVHVKSDYLAFVCENSADMGKTEQKLKKETVPKHGLGLKIVRGITERYNGLLDTEYGEHHYRICVEFPLF